MVKHKKLNAARSAILKALTKKIGASSSNSWNKEINKADIKKILIIRPNHRLGNQLLITPIVQEVIDRFPDCKIDLFVKGNVAPIIFQNYRNIDKIIRLPKDHFRQIFRYLYVWLSLRAKKYDLVINVIDGSSSGRLSTKLASSRYKFYSDENPKLRSKYSDYGHIAKKTIYNLRSFFSLEEKEIPGLDLKLEHSELEEGKKLLQDLVLDKDKKTICIYTYATGAKCYSEEWWVNFYKRLQSEYPDFNIIEILPVENISNIRFQAPALYSKDIRQMAALIANTEIFISADGGVMHLASAAKTPTLGLFSVTLLDSYTPYNNRSKGLDTKDLTTDEIINEINRILKPAQA